MVRRRRNTRGYYRIIYEEIKNLRGDMMLETIEDLLDWSKYGIIEEKGYIEIYNYINNTKMVDQEMFVKLGFVDNLYSIYQVSRGIERLVFECEDRIYFLAYVYFYVDKLYSD